MMKLYHFLRLIRTMNLVVIAVTMGVFQKFITRGTYIDLLQADFLLLVLSTLLIAAAGNIINDYFDVKADRVNKPELLIIDKYIKRRWAILFNWVFNSIGLCIALYLGWKYQDWMIPLIPFICINVLWFYSMYFKRTFFAGNFLVAILTGLVPVYVLIFNDPLSPVFVTNTWLFASFAFGTNLVREIVKDVADIKGDLLLGSKSIPIKWGLDNTRYLLFALTILLLVGMIGVMVILFQFLPEMILHAPQQIVALILISLAVLVTFCSLFFLPSFPNRRKYLMAANLLKLAMLFGLLIPLFI
ncbi:MAG: geranylgeranylglycerol-phosphate geranylgeranyltransferase [Crocinitomicaceae bacterium]|nr:geranylgeranylglycerol-phosphate geranylgeranyltransferase [Crocinitomicaceae bacterium]